MSILERYRKNKKDSNHEDVVKNSITLYQLKEHNGEIWLTYDGHLVCPCEMLKDDPVSAIKTMRQLYVDRTPKLTRF